MKFNSQWHLGKNMIEHCGHFSTFLARYSTPSAAQSPALRSAPASRSTAGLSPDIPSALRPEIRRKDDTSSSDHGQNRPHPFLLSGGRLYRLMHCNPLRVKKCGASEEGHVLSPIRKVQLPGVEAIGRCCAMGHTVVESEDKIHIRVDFSHHRHAGIQLLH